MKITIDFTANLFNRDKSGGAELVLLITVSQESQTAPPLKAVVPQHGLSAQRTEAEGMNDREEPGCQLAFIESLAG